MNGESTSLSVPSWRAHLLSLTLNLPSLSMPGCRREGAAWFPWRQSLPGAGCRECGGIRLHSRRCRRRSLPDCAGAARAGGLGPVLLRDQVRARWRSLVAVNVSDKADVALLYHSARARAVKTAPKWPKAPSPASGTPPSSQVRLLAKGKGVCEGRLGGGTPLC